MFGSTALVPLHRVSAYTWDSGTEGYIPRRLEGAGHDTARTSSSSDLHERACSACFICVQQVNVFKGRPATEITVEACSATTDAEIRCSSPSTAECDHKTGLESFENQGVTILKWIRLDNLWPIAPFSCLGSALARHENRY